MALPRAKLGVSLFRHPCRKPLSPGKGLFCWGYRPKSLLGATPQSKDALVACQKFCTMQNQQSKQHSTPHFQKTQRFIDRLKRALAFTDARFSVYCLSNLRSNHLSRYSVCKRYAKICGDVFGRKTAQLPKMSFTITKKAMRYQDELHNLPIWVMSFC